ncbi:MAG: transglycosylase domain-containing protein, partial [Bacteroidota bacterium]
MNFRYNKILAVLGVSFLVLFLAFFLFRNTLLHFFLNRKLNEYSERYHTQVLVSAAGFDGLNGLLLQGIQVAPGETDTLLQIDSVSARIRILPLLTGKIRFSSLEIANTFLHLIRKKERSNFSFLMKRKKEINLDSMAGKTDYSRLAERFLNSVFDAVPAAVNFRNSRISIEKDSLNLLVNVPRFLLSDHAFKTRVDFVENKETRSWEALGNIYAGDRKVWLKIFPAAKSAAEFPLLKQKWKLTVAFDTLQMDLSNMEYVENELHLMGKLSAANLQLNHWRISPNTVVIKNQTVDFLFRVGTNFFALDSTTSVTYNIVSYHPFLKFQIYPFRQFELDAKLSECNAQDFFESFPNGLFENIEGIKTTGSIFYRLHFFIDTRHPDELQFSSYLGKKNFKILGFGKTALSKINGEFLYTAYEKDRAVRTFSVGPSNPNYTPISGISNFLKTALLTSEDGNFYSHSGFNEDAFRKSIATNFKEKRFVRGG